MNTVHLSLGSNVGDREESLRTAIRKLNRRDFRITRVSSVYETAALDYAGQPDFLNCVVEAESGLFPVRLLLRTHNIEREMGRKRLIPKGPRNIDIDILLLGRFVVDTPQLKIPHPRIEERRFVLEPLAELAPDLRHPVHGRSVREMLAAAPHQRVVKLMMNLDFLLDGGQEGA
jgi:2-amino-4-hydroxy-6-hydroxymethyldihydropteridine diphosphokinase